jgi:hypothetical protein
MTTLSNSPRLLKGAIVAIDLPNPAPNLIVFQYNPDTMTRRLEPRTTGGSDSSDRSEPLRLTGPPKETITLSIEVDATDQLERVDPVTVAAGIYPTLAALETLIYPKSARITANDALALVGNIEIIPPEAPFTLFVWGPQRVLPVRITSFSITEEAFDQLLNPTQAKIELSLQVLSYMDFKQTHPGSTIFMAHHVMKEALAFMNAGSNVQSTGASLKVF